MQVCAWVAYMCLHMSKHVLEHRLYSSTIPYQFILLEMTLHFVTTPYHTHTSCRACWTDRTAVVSQSPASRNWLKEACVILIQRSPRAPHAEGAAQIKTIITTNEQRKRERITNSASLLFLIIWPCLHLGWLCHMSSDWAESGEGAASEVRGERAAGLTDRCHEAAYRFVLLHQNRAKLANNAR